MIRLGHSADLHAAYRQYGYRQRELDFYRILFEMADRAIALKLDAFLVAGDLFDVVKPCAEAVENMQRFVRQLENAGIPVIGIAGNHDAVEDDWLIVCGIRSCHQRTLTVTAKDTEQRVHIRGHHFRRPAQLLQDLQAEIDDGVKADIYLLHQPIKEMCGFAGEELSLDQLTPLFIELKVKYVALGDIHPYTYVEHDGIKYSYPGSPERCAADDTGFKSFNVVCVNDTGDVVIGTEPLHPRNFIRREIVTTDDLDSLPVIVQDPVTAPVVVLTYKPENKELAYRGERLLRSLSAMYRMYPLLDAATTEHVALAVTEFERKSAVDMLKKAVASYFEPSSHEYGIVFELFALAPQGPAAITEYLTRTLGQLIDNAKAGTDGMQSV